MRLKNIAKILPAAGLLLALAALSSCAAPARHHHGVRVLVIDAGHAHSAHCGHYRHGKRWFYIKGHVHGARCGHHLAGGVWLVR